MIFLTISLNLYLYTAHSAGTAPFSSVLHIKQKQQEKNEREQILQITCINMQRTVFQIIKSMSKTSSVARP